MMARRSVRGVAPLLVGGLLLGLLAGLLLGQLLGGGLFSAGFTDGQGARLRDDYVLMVATAYTGDRNLPAAWRRLRQVAAGDSVAWLQTTTGRFIANSRNVQDIRRLVALAEGLGRLTPAMEPWRQRGPSGAGP